VHFKSFACEQGMVTSCRLVGRQIGQEKTMGLQREFSQAAFPTLRIFFSHGAMTLKL